MYKIFLKIGDNCNLRCKYCMQEHSSNVYDCNDDFILALKKKYPDTIYCLLGGEPLLYKETLRHIIDDLLYDVRINVITNGKLIDEEWVSYFNERVNVKVIVSWDGTSSSNTRGYNVIENNYTNILHLKNLWISSLITNESYILDKLDVINKINCDRIALNLNPTIPNIKLAFGVVYDKDTIKRVSKELKQLRYGIYANKAEQEWFDATKTKLDNTYKSQDYFCGANIFVLHYTISGDKRRCFFDDRLDSVDMPYDNSIKSYCENCEVSKICMHQCPICLDNIDNFCSMCKAFYSFFL